MMLTKPKLPKNLNLNSKYINNSDTFKINDPKTWWKSNNNSKTLLNDIPEGEHGQIWMTPAMLDLYTKHFLQQYYVIIDFIGVEMFLLMDDDIEHTTQYALLKEELLSHMETLGESNQDLLKNNFLQNLDFSLPNRSDSYTGILNVATHVHSADFPGILAPYATYNVVVTMDSIVLETYMLSSAKSLYKELLFKALQVYENKNGQVINNNLAGYVQLAEYMAILNWSDPTVKKLKAVEGMIQY